MNNGIKKLKMGWFCPTNGDLTAFGDPEKTIPSTLDHFLKVAASAENAGFEYILVPVGPACWEAWTTASFIGAKLKKIKPLVAMKPGFVHPVAQAKMISAFCQFTDNRLYLNLIAGLSEGEAHAEGQLTSKEARYRKMEEEVTLLKKLLTEDKVRFDGEFYHVNEPVFTPGLPAGLPDFFLGGGSEQAIEISAKHSSVHLFWGDYPSVITENIKKIRDVAAKYGRENELEYAMRLQVICRETEEEAWDFAHQLVENAAARKITKQQRDTHINSVANSRQAFLAGAEDGKLTPHLWTGINTVRSGAGVAVVGNPRQVAEQLYEFVDAGCSGFCLSGYPHDKEADIFGKHVMPLLMKH
ncbi:Alkanesulfonate monooxygenase [Paraburkholderia domus]|uniref:LLM class flavin-dependent oxidoreductase n=1 Tax=Paraburkholderia domus TaxID=2793075 RepID=UPI001911D9DC|nr:LLM class flavin-dependent oxidoreductase [Paraburkholderia domus]MBK5050457.1 LLM class flavin-dependent oxidoreductase [Burkholderia sp. R-70006]CAE6754645.1 Alkanesulfonate monooxygenase [Paraburkholderia domus]